MDIPLPDELELLEADFHLYDDYLEPELPEIDEEEDEQEKESSDSRFQQLNSSNFSNVELDLVTEPLSVNGLKRPRSDVVDVPTNLVLDAAEPSGAKKNRTDKPVVENEEDWLRYSPPSEKNSMVEEEMSSAVEEKTIFRYVSEIDGDFMPITAPDSDERVYAKLSRFGDKEELKKLDLKERHGGKITYFINFFFVVLSILATVELGMVNLFIIGVDLRPKFTRCNNHTKSIFTLILFGPSIICLCLLFRFNARKYQCFTGKSGEGDSGQGMQSYEDFMLTQDTKSIITSFNLCSISSPMFLFGENIVHAGEFNLR